MLPSCSPNTSLMVLAATLELSLVISSGSTSVATAGSSGPSSRTTVEGSAAREPLNKKLSSLVTLSTVARSSSVTLGLSLTLRGRSAPGRSRGTVASPKPTCASTLAALSLLSASIPLTASSSKNSRKIEPCGESTNWSASRVCASWSPPRAAGAAGAAVGKPAWIWAKIWLRSGNPPGNPP